MENQMFHFVRIGKMIVNLNLVTMMYESAGTAGQPCVIIQFSGDEENCACFYNEDREQLLRFMRCQTSWIGSQV